MTIFELSLPWI